jgi:DNA-binding MarR family transcriptional regulator
MGNETQPLWRRAAAHTLHTALVLKALLEERLQAETGLLLADNEALLNLAHSREPLRMSDIARRVILSRGGATKVIDRLEELGYVERAGAEDDRRVTVVGITSAGRHALTKARSVIDGVLKEAWAPHVDDADATVVVDVMDRVLRANHPT